MKLDLEQVSWLAKISLTGAEQDRFASESDAVFKKLDELGAVDTRGAERTMHPVTVKNVFREDVMERYPNRELILKNAAVHDGACYIVPGVL